MNASGLAYARSAEPLQFRIRLQRRNPYGGECTHAAYCLSGIGAPQVDMRMTRYLSAASSGQGHVRADRRLPTPCRRDVVCTLPNPVSTVRVGGIVNQVTQAQPCLHQTTVHLSVRG